MRLAAFLVGLQIVVTTSVVAEPPASWDKIAKVRLAADLKFFWNVGGGDVALVPCGSVPGKWNDCRPDER
jgi:hypothetical protein